MTNPQIDRLLALSERARRHGLSMPGEPAWHIEQAERESVLRALHDYETWLPSLASEFKSLLAKIAELEGERGIELDVNGEAMVCMGCGTTRSIAGIKARSTTAFSCCPERKMIPVRNLLAERDAASARVGEMREALEPFAKRAASAGSYWADDMPLGNAPHTVVGLTLGDLRRARLARGEG